MGEWKEYKLGDVVSISSGFAYKGDLIGKGESFLLGMGCVSFKEKFLHSGARLYAGDCPDRYCAEVGDIVLATRQQSDNLPILGMPAIIPDTYANKKLIIGANLYKVTNNSDFDNKYIYWLLKSVDYVQYIRSCQSGTSVRMITKANIENYTFKAPDKVTRDKISNILWNIEYKIDLLNRENATLEAMAETLFRQWFIEEAKEDWDEGKLGDLIEVKYGKDHKKLHDGNIPVLGSGGIMRYADTALYDKESVLIPRKGSLNNVMYINEPFWTVDTMFYTEMRRPNIAKFIYHFMKGQDLANMNVGSAVPSMTTEVLNNILIDIPSQDVFDKFEDFVVPLYNKKEQNNKQIQTLIHTRDGLIPKLMSDEVKM